MEIRVSVLEHKPAQQTPQQLFWISEQLLTVHCTDLFMAEDGDLGISNPLFACVPKTSESCPSKWSSVTCVRS